MDDVPVFRLTVIAGYDFRDAERAARDRRLRRSDWVFVENGERLWGLSPDCPLVITESFAERRDAMAIAEELRQWKRFDATTTPVDAPTQPG